jgi:hypothetical protein
MASMPGSILLSVDAPVGRRAARRIAALIVWAGVAAAGGLGICTFILFSLSAPWFGAVSLLLGIGALVRALSLRRKISAARLGSARSATSTPAGATNASPGGTPSPAPDSTPQSPLPRFSDPASSLAAKTESPHLSSLSDRSAGGTHTALDEFMGHSPTAVRFTQRELQDLDLDQREPDDYRPSVNQGGPGTGLWIGVGIVVLIGVVVLRGRSARAKRAETAPDNATDSAQSAPARDAAKIPRSSLGEGTTSSLSGIPGSGSTTRSTAGLDAAAVPPIPSGAAPQSRRRDRFTPSPKLAQFAVVPLFASFVLAYFAIRTAGSNTLSVAIPLAAVSLVALGAAFYLAPAS